MTAPPADYLQIPMYRCAGNKKIFNRIAKVLNKLSGVNAEEKNGVFIITTDKKIENKEVD